LSEREKKEEWTGKRIHKRNYYCREREMTGQSSKHIKRGVQGHLLAGGNMNNKTKQSVYKTEELWKKEKKWEHCRRA